MERRSTTGRPLTAAQQHTVQLLMDRGAASGLKEQDASLVVRYMRPRRYAADTVIERAGVRRDNPEMALVLSGEVCIETENAGGDRLVLTIYGPGDLFGEMSLIDGEAPAATCLAVTDVVVASLSRSGLKRLIKERPGVAMRLLMTVTRCIVKKLRQTNKKLVMVTSVGRAQQHELDAVHSANQQLLDRIGVLKRESGPGGQSGF